MCGIAVCVASTPEPCGAAVENLAQEGITAGVAKVGDVMYDATLHAAARARSSSRVLERLHLTDGAFALATIHRAENADAPENLSQILVNLPCSRADPWPRGNEPSALICRTCSHGPCEEASE